LRSDPYGLTAKVGVAAHHDPLPIWIMGHRQPLLSQSIREEQFLRAKRLLFHARALWLLGPGIERWA
jgi:hypothetical protein